MKCDLLVIGAGAAGLTAAIFAAEAADAAGKPLSILLVEGALKPGAKLLATGGGRCNATNVHVAPEDFSGGPRTIIRKVLRGFDQPKTVEWMCALGVELQAEPDGRMFPSTGQARTVLNALLKRVAALGVPLAAGRRVVGIEPQADGFSVQLKASMPVPLRPGESPILARRIIVATGGLAMPKSGSDGAGIKILERLGHTIVPTTPALSPLVLEHGAELGGLFAEFSGVALEIRLCLRSSDGRVLAETAGQALFTHFGLSGPAALDFSRHLARHQIENPGAAFSVTMGHKDFRSIQDADLWLRQKTDENPKIAAATAANRLFTSRFAWALGEGFLTLGRLTRAERLALAERLGALPLPVAGTRGYEWAEVTAGGVNLREIDAATMESRIVRGLHICGEALDADGRMGGFNLQWAWSTGALAGRGAARGAIEPQN